MDRIYLLGQSVSVEHRTGYNSWLSPMWLSRGLLFGIALIVAGAIGIRVLPTYPTRATAGWFQGIGAVAFGVSLVGLALTGTGRRGRLHTRLLALAVVIVSVLILGFTFLLLAIGAAADGGVSLSASGWILLIGWVGIWLLIPTVGVRRFLQRDRRNRQRRET